MQHRKVLVVDDNVDAADVVAAYLAFKGYEVAIANGGREAVATARHFSPDVIFLDIGMPGMSGYEVASTLRGAPWFPSTRIVALTAWGDSASRARAVASGFDAHLVKPAQLESLLREADFAAPHR